MFIINKVLSVLIIIFFNINMANGVDNNDLNTNVENYYYEDAENNNNSITITYTPEEFIQRLNNNALPNVAIIVIGDVEIKKSPITKLPDNLTIVGNLYLKKCDNLTKLPKNISVYALYITNCPNFEYQGGANFPIAM